MDDDKRTQPGVDAISLLLRPDAPEVVRARGTVTLQVKRLTKALGAPFEVTLRGLSYNQYHDLVNSQDFTVEVVLEGLVSPNVRDQRLLEHYKAPTPAELVKAVFLPGELAEMANRIEQLTGFRKKMLEEIKKN